MLLPDRVDELRLGTKYIPGGSCCSDLDSDVPIRLTKGVGISDVFCTVHELCEFSEKCFSRSTETSTFKVEVGDWTES